MPLTIMYLDIWMDLSLKKNNNLTVHHYQQKHTRLYQSTEALTNDVLVKSLIKLSDGIYTSTDLIKNLI